MKRKRYDSLLLTTLGVVTLGALCILLAVGFLTKNNPALETKPTVNAEQPLSVAAAAAPLTSTAAATSLATTPTQSSKIKITVPSVAVGELIPLPSELNTRGQAAVRRAAQPAHLLIDDVVGAINSPWAKGGIADNGAEITLTATFGLVTLGKRGNDGVWYGFSNIPEFSCTGIRQCSKTGKLLDHIENRPMWLLDYKNVVTQGSGSSYNHTVYAVDDTTGLLFYAWGYND